MEKEKVERINALARKSKTVGLTEDEKKEQQRLRAEYLADFRAGFSQVLKNTVIEYPDGSRETLPEFKKRKESDEKSN